MPETTLELMQELYEEFRGLPNEHPIVRNNTPNDAYPLAILKLNYAKTLGIDVVADKIEVVSSYIVAPPDSGIDMFIEIEDGDDYYYHVIQVKYEELTESQIHACYIQMKEAMRNYTRDSSLVSSNLRRVIEQTNYTKDFIDNCSYFVYHSGTVKEGPLLRNRVTVATVTDLDIILDSLNHPGTKNVLKVPSERLTSDSFNNFMEYVPNDAKNNHTALLCSIRGYDLALLCDKYYSTAQGRNILFGQNLRESLAKKSKTSKEMKDTIDESPEKFWHYNNGITIIAEDVDIVKDEQSGKDVIQLKHFSIINGAQTTSTLREYYIDHKFDQVALEKLKRVYVLARLMEIADDQQFGNDIAIYNNTQNAISSRDMVANNTEQKALYDKCLNEGGEAPHMFVQIKNGSIKPVFPRIEKHQATTNEELAQLAYAAFCLEPFSAKDKKRHIFSKDETRSENVLINESYDKIFRYEIDYDDDNNPINSQGILFQKKNYEIDEVLFIKYLYRVARAEKRRFLDDMIQQTKDTIARCEAENNQEEATQHKDLLVRYQRNREINNTCMFYCITFYFTLRSVYRRSNEGLFDYGQFYGGGDSTYKADLIRSFSDKFLNETIALITELLGAENNVNNWVRRAGSQKVFRDKVNDKLVLGPSYSSMYQDFVNAFKIIPIGND